MEYEEFKRTVQRRIQNEFPEAEVFIKEAEKNNGTRKEGIVVRKKGEDITPCVYLQEIYKCYEQDGDIERCIQMACESAVSRKDMPDIKIPESWEEGRGRISLRLVNTEWNREYLAKVPHKEYLDLSVTFHLTLQKSEEAVCSMPVTGKVMKYLDISMEELYQAGMESIKEKSQFAVKRLSSLLEEMITREESSRSLNFSKDIFVMMNEGGTYGSCGMLAVQQLEKFAREIGDDFYILPCSVHELILVPSAMETSLDNLRHMVQEVNNTSVLPEERLSDSVYYYSREKGAVQLAGE